MRNDYVEAKPSMLSNINIVPLVGVFAALLVVIMLGFPSVVQKHNNDYSWSCRPYHGPHTHKLEVHVDSSGNSTLDNVAMTNAEISDAISSAPQHIDHRIIAEIDIDADTSYQDTMSLISALHKAGLEEKNIRLRSSRWR